MVAAFGYEGWSAPPQFAQPEPSVLELSLSVFSVWKFALGLGAGAQGVAQVWCRRDRASYQPGAGEWRALGFEQSLEP